MAPCDSNLCWRESPRRNGTSMSQGSLVVRRAILSVICGETLAPPDRMSLCSATRCSTAEPPPCLGVRGLPAYPSKRPSTQADLVMELSTLGLAIIPPALAILVERLNPISERLLRASAEQDLRDYETTNHVPLIDAATKFANGAVEVAGLAPT